MKKIVKILTPFLLACSTLLGGCKKNNEPQEEKEKAILSFGDIHATETRVIEFKDFDKLVAKNLSFALVISTESCGCWRDTFKPIIFDYIARHKIICYQIDYNDIVTYGATYGLTRLSDSTTSFAIFNEGKLFNKINSQDNQKVMSDQTYFEKYMEEMVRLPSCYFITKDDALEMKASGKNAVIYYERETCGDCSAVNPTLLRSYIKNHKNMKNIYVVDLDPFRGTEQYQTVKDDLGLSNEYNSTYGWDKYGGVVPYFSYVSNNTFASGCVIYNDGVEKDANDVYHITSSFYSEDRKDSLAFTNEVLVGKEIPTSDLNINSYGASWSYDAANKVYEGILNSFLDLYLPQTNV